MSANLSDEDESMLAFDEDLDSLISGHRNADEVSLGEEAKNEVQKNENEGGISDAALDSLRELVASGAMSEDALKELEMEMMGQASKQVDASKVIEIKKETVTQVQDIPENKFNGVEAKESDDSSSEKKSVADSIVRVNVSILDKIMNLVGELVLNRNQIVQYSNQQNNSSLNKLSSQLNIITSDLQQEVMSTRMQPIGSILTKFERMVRDFSRENNKKIILKLAGQETELDKTLIEAIKDPLVHIIRNACDHGMETVSEREKSGKYAEGVIYIKSFNESGQVSIEISDDGRGLNKSKIAAKAIEKGLATQDEINQMSDGQIFGMIFRPGFSTAEKVTNISGRGVGMDVVKTNIEKIGGSVQVNSEMGKGTTFKLRIPLTLAIVPALMTRTNGEHFAIPQLNLVELVRLETPEEKALLEKIHDSEFLRLRGKLTPIFRVGPKLALELVEKKSTLLNKVAKNENIIEVGRIKEASLRINVNSEAYNIVIISADEQVFGLIVDEILDTEEIVVKPLSSQLKNLAIFSGATIMGDGKIALILDAFGLYSSFMTSHDKNLVKKNEIDIKNIEKKNESYDIQENLLIKLRDGNLYGVPLSLVTRLEEFDVDQIEYTGKQPIIRYLGVPMPLIDMEKALELDGASLLQEMVTNNQIKSICCVVIKIRGHIYAMAVKEILDISVDHSLIDDSAVDRDGILGTIFIKDKIVSLLDVFNIIDKQTFVVKKQTDIPKNITSKMSNHKKPKILLVEDSQMYRKLESEFLKELGADVVVSKNGEEGFSLIEENQYDIVVTDIEMPLMNGFELAKKIRETNNKNTLVPIVAISTRVSRDDLELGKRCGFDYHLEKLKKDELAQVILKILEEKAA